MSAGRIGWAAAKANAVPMVVLWCLAAATVAAYYLVPGVAAAFEPLMRWQVESGWVAAFLNRFVFAGLLPGVFMLSLPHLRAPVRPVASIFVIGVWCGLWGIATDAFFHLQSIWFGDRPDLAVVNLCEMKFSQKEYAIDKEEYVKIRNRIEAVREKIGAKRPIHLTVETANGLAHNMYRNNVQSEITLDDLFVPA